MLYQILEKYKWTNIRKSYKNNKSKTPVPFSNLKFELPDIMYSVSDIQDYFDYIIKKHENMSDNPPIRIYVNKIETRTIFKIKILMSETMKLLRSTKTKITKDKNGENVRHLEMTEVVLVYFHCNAANNDYQGDSRVLYAFVPNKSVGQLLDVSPKYLIFLKTFNVDFLYIEVWCTDKNPKPLEIEDKINIT